MLRILNKHSKVIGSFLTLSTASIYLLNSNKKYIMAQEEERSPTTMPTHHTGNGFQNPWPSFTKHGILSTLKMIVSIDLGSVVKKAKADDYPEKVDINWNLLKNENKQNDQIISTWLGHACIFVQINEFNILFDPIFSGRCSPSQLAGPKRYTQPPCKLEELPKIDAVVISHNHYDHLDLGTIQTLAKLNPDTRFFVPLGNKSWFGDISKEKDSLGNDRVVELDWWQTVSIGKEASQSLIFTCTPCQHFSGRTPFDNNKTLWASWCVEAIQNNVKKSKIFFGGDTGYRSVPISAGSEKEYDEEYLDSLPHCPVFKEIGDKFGCFDVSYIPIGAYSPRWFMSPIHLSPEDAVRVHEDIKSKHSIGIHWGTFALTNEAMEEPPKRLKKALEKRGHSFDDFNVLKLGESHITKI
ncbi:unnamed protein product [Cunninghamella echinulata]